jgi:NADPH-dependent 7-cyano-7-deazaguanine reductase QueF
VKLARLRSRRTRILNQISTVPFLSEAFTSLPHMTNQADFVTV